MEEICVKEDLDDIIQFDIDKVVCIRFGSASDVQTIHLDEIVRFSFLRCSFPPILLYIETN